MKDVKVSGIMHRDLISLSPDVSIRDAIDMMASQHIGSIFIQAGELKECGIITERDVLNIVAKSIDLSEPVSTVMSKDLIYVGPEDNLLEVFTMMIDNLIRHAPIKDENDKVISILSLRAICQTFRTHIASGDFT
ncbi:MAG: CBS domain-containing protein [Bacteriovoracaceae bacterium]|jgi:predicted transcriptional regulator|nr:CBS domain-containing protein [Bacteriovoracaceae bacterium]